MRVTVIGAGASGLSAAGELQRCGHQVTVVDKGRGPGGRLATRRIGTATLDHGAQFFTVRSEQFSAVVMPLIQAGLIYEWCRGFVDGGDGYPRYAVRDGMNALAKRWAQRLDVRCDTRAFAVDTDRTVVIDDGSRIVGDAVVVTCPLPQSASLLMSSGIHIPTDVVHVDYDRTLALLVTLDGPSLLGPPGAVPSADDTFSMIVDNAVKGVSRTSAMTFHANAAWSLKWWDRPPNDTLAELERQAELWLGGASIVEAQLKRWRFATPQRLWPARCWASPAGHIVLAGDAFAGPADTHSNIEGAVLSGLAAADQLMS